MHHKTSLGRFLFRLKHRILRTGRMGLILEWVCPSCGGYLYHFPWHERERYQLAHSAECDSCGLRI